MNGLFQEVRENLIFVLESLSAVLLVGLIALWIEKAAARKTGNRERMFSARKIAVIGMFSALAAVLHILDFPVPFAPPFYKLDFSELPALIGSFAFGPVAGVLIELCKIVIKLLFKGTSTAFVGDLANFLVGCSLILPACGLYIFRKTKKRAILGCAVGTLVMTAFGSLLNGVYLIPKFAELYGMPLDAIIDMGSAIHASIHSIYGLVILCVAPLNLLKGTVVSLLTILIYKKISPILHGR